MIYRQQGYFQTVAGFQDHNYRDKLFSLLIPHDD